MDPEGRPFRTGEGTVRADLLVSRVPLWRGVSFRDWIHSRYLGSYSGILRALHLRYRCCAEIHSGRLRP